MANDINTVVLVGHLTRDSEIRYTESGLAILNISLAVNRSRKQGDQYVEEVSFFNVKAFGKMAENLQHYLVKGKQIAVTGFLKQERWEKDGQKQSMVTVGAEQIQLLGGKDANGNDNGNGGNFGGYGYGN